MRMPRKVNSSGHLQVFKFGQVVDDLYSYYLLWQTEVKQIGVGKWESRIYSDTGQGSVQIPSRQASCLKCHDWNDCFKNVYPKGLKIDL